MNYHPNLIPAGTSDLAGLRREYNMLGHRIYALSNWETVRREYGGNEAVALEHVREHTARLHEVKLLIESIENGVTTRPARTVRVAPVLSR